MTLREDAQPGLPCGDSWSEGTAQGTKGQGQAMLASPSPPPQRPIHPEAEGKGTASTPPRGPLGQPRRPPCPGRPHRPSPPLLLLVDGMELVDQEDFVLPLLDRPEHRVREKVAVLQAVQGQPQASCMQSPARRPACSHEQPRSQRKNQQTRTSPRKQTHPWI